MLQSTTVYANVSKGVLAKREDLLKVFGTDDEERICLKILAEGELQVGAGGGRAGRRRGRLGAGGRWQQGPCAACKEGRGGTVGAGKRGPAVGPVASAACTRPQLLPQTTKGPPAKGANWLQLGGAPPPSTSPPLPARPWPALARPALARPAWAARPAAQVSDKERKVELETLFRDVASVLSEKCINPESRRPYTITMIERALRDAHFNVDPKRPAKAQALEVRPGRGARGVSWPTDAQRSFVWGRLCGRGAEGVGSEVLVVPESRPTRCGGLSVGIFPNKEAGGWRRAARPALLALNRSAPGRPRRAGAPAAAAALPH